MAEEQNCAKRGVAKRAGKALVWFMCAMLALTYASRALSEALKPRVRTGYALSAALDESASGSGEWVAGDTRFYTTAYAQRVSRVFVQAGDAVSEGDPLFAFDVTGRDESQRKDKKARKELEKNRDKAASACKRAQAAYAKAEDDAYARCSAQGAEQALANAQFALAQFDALTGNGTVRATFSGILVQCDLAEGKPTTVNGTGFAIAAQGLTFAFYVSPAQAKRIAPGDQAVLSRDGKETVTLTVSSVAAPDAQERVKILCAGENVPDRRIGAQEDWTVKKQSRRYDVCVPLGALGQEGPQSYCVFVLAQEETILGTQFVAQKRTVEYLARDGQRAAVKGDIGERDKLIVETSRALQDGDRVALEDA